MSHASTGPRTAAGKAVSSQNAFAHGLTAARLVLPWENAAEFDQLLNDLVAEHQPVTATEGILVREIAEQYWRLQRARNREHLLLCESERVANEPDINVFLAWEKDVALASRYATRHERAFHKCLRTLRTLQKERRQNEAEASEPETNQEATAQAAAATVTTATQPPQFVSQNASTNSSENALNSNFPAGVTCQFGSQNNGHGSHHG